MGLSLLLSLGSGQALAQSSVSLPFDTQDVPLVDLVDEVVYDVSISALPNRPRLVVEVTPPATHPDIELEVELTNCVVFPEDPGQSCPTAIPPTPTIGPASVTYDVYTCNPFGSWANQGCDAEIRVLDFGTGGAPVSVDVSIRGETVVPSSTESVAVDLTPVLTTVEIPRFRDTTIYEEDFVGSNGQGDYLWAGERVTGTFPFSLERHELRGLISFDVDAYVPATAEITDVEIVLEVLSAQLAGTTPTISLSTVDVRDDNPFAISQWYSGDAEVLGASLAPGTSLVQSATWTHKQYPFSPWNTQGGDVTAVVASTPLGFFPGPMSFQSSRLISAVETMWSTGDDRDGFLVTASGLNPATTTSQAVGFATGEIPSASLRPAMFVEYLPATGPPASGTINSGTLQFIGEGVNFRWIYDDDQDDVVETDIGGRCEIDSGPLNPLAVPYTYSFDGSPSYQGLDCCTWQIDSQTNTTGTGQALFYLNLDPLDPANLPGDFDGDGIFDLCDSCPYTPNGPEMGTCLGGPTAGATCLSDEACGSGGNCSLAQEDSDQLVPGDVCAAPEPGFATALIVGVGGITAIGRRGPRRRRDAGAVERSRQMAC